jgi:hypothetical protein
MPIIFKSILIVCVFLVIISICPLVYSGANSQELSAELASCSAVLVPNELLTRHSNSTDDAFFDAMCGDWYTSHQQVVDSSLGVSAVIELIPIGVSADNTTTNIRVSRTQYCSQTNRRVSQRTKDMFWSRVVPDTARTQWLSCIGLITGNAAGQTHPITARLRPVGVQNVTLSILFNANTGGPKPRLAGIEPTNLSCKKVNGTPTIPSQGSGITVNCQWTSPEANVGAVIVRTTNRGAEIATINRDLPPFLTAELELHTPANRLVRTDTVCGDWFGTTDMHNWEKEDNTDGRCTKSSDDGKWCKGNYHQTVTARSGGRLRNPRFECRGNNDSCGWNAIGSHQWFTATPNGSSISGETWAGSRAVELRLCTEEDVFGTSDEVSRPTTWTLAKGAGFVVEIPRRSTGILNLRFSNGNTALEVGKSNNVVTMIDSTPVGDITKWSYRVNP